MAFGLSRSGTGNKKLASCKKVEGGVSKRFCLFSFFLSYHLISVAFRGHGVSCVAHWANTARRPWHVLHNCMVFNCCKIGNVRRFIHCLLCANVLGGYMEIRVANGHLKPGNFQIEYLFLQAPLPISRLP